MNKDNFGVRLDRILLDRDMTQTDLARLVWNETYVDKRGYEVVKGKDRISSYINGKQQPSSLVYNKILDVLKLTPEELPIRKRPSEWGAVRRAAVEDTYNAKHDEIEHLTADREHWREIALTMMMEGNGEAMSDTFGARLERILVDRKMTQTDLARRVWGGTRTDPNGYEVVNGKDQISGYINSRRMPGRLTYERILEALNLKQEELPLLRITKRKALQPSRIDSLIAENERLKEERDHWRDTAKQLSEVVTTLAIELKERRHD